MTRRILYAVGAVLIGIGLAGMVTHSPIAGWAIWFAGAAVVHDALLAPLVIGATHLTRRMPGRFALVPLGVITLVALPMVLGLGRRPDNPSVLPQAYGTNLVMISGLVIAAVVVRNAYSHRMGKAILAIVGVLLSIWLIFMVIGMIISALKFLIWVGFLAVLAAVIVTLVGKLAKSK